VALPANGRQHLPAFASLRGSGFVLLKPRGVEEDAIVGSYASERDAKAALVMVVLDLWDVLDERL
jgi:hypothetical protein